MMSKAHQRPANQPVEPRLMWLIRVDGRMQRRGILAPTKAAAEEKARLRWGLDQTAHVEAEMKFPVGRTDLHGDITGTESLPPSTPADALTCKLLRTMLEWDARTLEARARVTQHQREHVEAGLGNGAVKAAMFRAMRDAGAPVEQISGIVETFFKQRALKSSSVRAEGLRRSGSNKKCDSELDENNV
jgi:hypothetical protein